MPLEDILQEVEKRRDEEIKRISDEYKTKINSENSEVDKQISKLEEHYRKKTEDDSRAMRERETELASMEAKNIEREKVSELMHDAFERANYILRNIAESKEYPNILKKMVNLSLQTLGNDCTVRVRKEDMSFLQDMNRVKIAKGHIKEPGIIAESSDGSKELNLTIPVLMEDLREPVSQELMQHIGEE